jgi:hypothetical protein
LTKHEQQRLEIIQIYPFLKNGEVWKDIKQELENEEVRPTMDDKHWMDTCIEEANEQAESAIYNQSLVMHGAKQ